MFKRKRIGFFGAGNMAEALAKGLLAAGVPQEALLASDLAEARRKGNRDVRRRPQGAARMEKELEAVRKILEGKK